ESAQKHCADYQPRQPREIGAAAAMPWRTGRGADGLYAFELAAEWHWQVASAHIVRCLSTLLAFRPRLQTTAEGGREDVHHHDGYSDQQDEEFQAAECHHRSQKRANRGDESEKLPQAEAKKWRVFWGFFAAPLCRAINAVFGRRDRR